jgi:hypothetical protein
MFVLIMVTSVFNGSMPFVLFEFYMIKDKELLDFFDYVIKVLWFDAKIFRHMFAKLTNPSFIISTQDARDLFFYTSDI